MIFYLQPLSHFVRWSVVPKQKIIPLYGWIPERPKGADCKSVAIASKVRILLRPVDIR